MNEIENQMVPGFQDEYEQNLQDGEDEEEYEEYYKRENGYYNRQEEE